MFTVSEKIATWKFLPHTDNWLASRPNTYHYTDSHFSCKSKKANKNGKSYSVSYAQVTDTGKMGKKLL